MSHRNSKCRLWVLCKISKLWGVLVQNTNMDTHPCSEGQGPVTAVSPKKSRRPCSQKGREVAGPPYMRHLAFQTRLPILPKAWTVFTVQTSIFTRVMTSQNQGSRRLGWPRTFAFLRGKRTKSRKMGLESAWWGRGGTCCKPPCPVDLPKRPWAGWKLGSER